MSALQGVLFTVLIVMALVWFVCLRRFSHLLLDRYPEKYDEMALDELWHRNNAKPSMAILRFLLRHEDLDLNDAGVSNLTTFMRWWFLAFVGLFAVLGYTILRDAPEDRVAEAPVEASIPVDRQRDGAFDLYRAQKWTQAIAAFDALIHESDSDAEVRYFRGLTHWRQGRTGEALQDMRRVIELEPTNFPAHRDADRILSQQQRWDEVIDLWDGYLRRVPNDAEAYYERGGAHFRKKDLAAAHADATRACQLGKVDACSRAERLKSSLP